MKGPRTRPFHALSAKPRGKRKIRAASDRAYYSSSSLRRFTTKSCTFVTMFQVRRIPRSFSLFGGIPILPQRSVSLRHHYQHRNRHMRFQAKWKPSDLSCNTIGLANIVTTGSSILMMEAFAAPMRWIPAFRKRIAEALAASHGTDKIPRAQMNRHGICERLVRIRLGSGGSTKV